MFVVLGLLAFLVLLDIAALTGWAPSTRDGRDWRRTEPTVGHSSSPSRVDEFEPTRSSSGAPHGTHATAV